MSWAWQFAEPLFPSSLVPDWMKTQSHIRNELLSNDLDELLKRNQKWANDQTCDDPHCFKRTAEVQSPKILWIGCSDSRVPETEIFKARPGDFFVHRNIANVAHENDTSLNSVIEYAVEALKVEHIVVCGHYGCGGVKAAMDPPAELKSICDWIKPIQTVLEDHAESLTEIDDDTKWRALVHLNAHQSLDVIKRHPSIQKRLASKSQPPLYFHHWVYDVHTGLVSPKCHTVAENALSLKQAQFSQH